jgi:SNF2 family DNA or RNA helicase
MAGLCRLLLIGNHVIHYGRWWNPAVEAQATDRAYRLGQTKKVTVYLPILKDETRRISRSFDQLLDELMERKKGLAEGALQKDEFLIPQESEDEAGLQVCAGLVTSMNP